MQDEHLAAFFVKRETKTNISTSSNGHFSQKRTSELSECKGQLNVRISTWLWTQLQFKYIDDYIHFYINFIIFCKLYITDFNIFCLPFVYEYFAVSGYSVIPALNEAELCTC